MLPQLGIKEAAPVKNKVSEEEESEDNEEDMEDEAISLKHWLKYTLNSKDILRLLKLLKKLKF